MKDFFHHLLSADQSVVNSMTVLAILLAAPVMLLCFMVVVNEVWFLHKGLTPQVTQLLQVMMGAATGGVIGQGVSMFSKTTMNQVTSIGGVFSPTHKAGPAPDPDAP